MILATVITCPQRWDHYQRFRRNFATVGLGFPVRTFQTKEVAGDAYANNNLNARAALAYANRHLPEGGWLLYLEDDVVISPALAPLLPELVRVGEAEGVDCWNLCNRKNSVARQFRLGLSAVSAQAGLSAVSAQAGLSAVSAQAGLSAVSAQAGLSAGAPQPGLSAVSGPADDVVVNELAYPVSGAHGLLIPKRHLGAMLAGHWSQVSDLSMFAAILSAVSAQAGHHPALKIWQVVKPVLVEHVGYISTYDPERRPKTLEVNHAD